MAKDYQVPVNKSINEKFVTWTSPIQLTKDGETYVSDAIDHMKHDDQNGSGNEDRYRKGFYAESYNESGKSGVSIGVFLFLVQINPARPTVMLQHVVRPEPPFGGAGVPSLIKGHINISSE